jgi:hypothetical protein
LGHVHCPAGRYAFRAGHQSPHDRRLGQAGQLSDQRQDICRTAALLAASATHGHASLDAYPDCYADTRANHDRDRHGHADCFANAGADSNQHHAGDRYGHGTAHRNGDGDCHAGCDTYTFGSGTHAYGYRDADTGGNAYRDANANGRDDAHGDRDG